MNFLMIGKYFPGPARPEYRAAAAHTSRSLPGIFSTLVTPGTLDSEVTYQLDRGLPAITRTRRSESDII
jgi:hypothetical protein